MANLPETEDFADGLYQIETSDRVLGGPGGIANKQAEQLGNRTAWLRAAIAKIVDGTTAVGKATQLAAARSLKFKGAVSGSGSYDGTGDTEIALTLVDTGVAAGTYTKVAINVKGLVTGASNPTTLAGYGITDAFTKPETTTAIQQAVSNLVASSPAALDTLKELAVALGNDPNFATTMTNALAGKAGKATTLGGYGITDAILSTPQTGVVGKVADIAKHNIGVYASGTTDSPPSSSGGLFLHMKYPGETLAAFDIFGHVGGGNDIFGFRRVLADGAFLHRTVYHDGNFNPASYMPVSGGSYSPSFSSLRITANTWPINNPGAFVAYGTDGLFTNAFNSVCNRSSGTGGFTWRTVNADNSVTGPTMTYSNDGRLAVPVSLSAPAITGNTTVWDQPSGYAGPYIANCAFVSAAVNSRPKDTALLAPNGWSKNADTGEIKQWIDVVVGDFATVGTVNVTWPFKFPNQILNVKIGFKLPTGTQFGGQAHFNAITMDGATIRLEEWASVVQTGLVLMVEARGN